MENQFFKNVERKTGVNMNEIFQLASSLKAADFRDEKTVRRVIRQVSQIANRPITKEKEDKLVETILKNGKNLDFNTINHMLNKK
jgi:hypothetical protein